MKLLNLAVSPVGWSRSRAGTWHAMRLRAKGEPHLSVCGRPIASNSIATGPLGYKCRSCRRSLAKRGTGW